MLEYERGSQCIEDVEVVLAFARTVDEGKGRVVVLDTTQTGNTKPPLDATQAYQLEIMRTQGDMPEFVRELLPRVGDRD